MIACVRAGMYAGVGARVYACRCACLNMLHACIHVVMHAHMYVMQ